jgi:hypothetical protein
MPTSTERQLAADALHQAFLVDFIAELEARELLDEEGSDSDSGSDDSDDDMDSSGSSSDFLETSSSDDMEDHDEPTAAEIYMERMAQLYSERYLQDRQPIPKSQEFKMMLLGIYKREHTEIFRLYLRITVSCFDALVSVLEEDPIFHNNSPNEQMPVVEQLAIALYRFGHYGNGASVKKVALLFGVGYGTVKVVTARVLKACCSEQFRSASVQWVDAATKETAKVWVEKASCPEWRNGWLMVDGTLVPLFRRPAFFGNTWFDRKSNYSMNVQVKFLDFGIKCIN